MVCGGVESATKAAQDRDLLQAVRHDAKTRDFDALWVLDKSRLARSAGAVETVATAFALADVEVHTQQGRVDLDSAEGEFMAGIEAIADRLSSRRSRERTLQSRKAMLPKGEHAFRRSPFR